MGYGSIAKSIGKSAANTALDVVPGGKQVKGIIHAIGGIFGKGPPDAKAMERARKMGHAAAAGDSTALMWLKQAAAGGSKYASVQQRAQAWLNVIAKGSGSRSDGMQWLKATSPVLVSGAGPMASAEKPMPAWGSLGSYPPPSPASRRRRRKRRRTYTSSRKHRSTPRKSHTRKRRKATTHSRKRRLKFGSRAWRMKYLGHK